MKKIKAGAKVTCKIRRDAYYSGYGGNPECYFEPGDIGIVHSTNLPYPFRNQCFSTVDFEKNGRSWRVDLTNDNIVEIKE